MQKHGENEFRRFLTCIPQIRLNKAAVNMTHSNLITCDAVNATFSRTANFQATNK